ncbi:MAG: hypothetical protein EHM41_06220 [Chloroflexi bacterium]|nr:MAG: hypothetical protein EHM41_06220 [Chloroflexota bacterium]
MARQPITDILVKPAGPDCNLACNYCFYRDNSRLYRFPNLLPVLLPALMLGFQHIAAPFVVDARFIAWRGLMFIPFAFAIGIILHWRPRLLPYAAFIHVLMDLSFATMFLSVGY